MCVFQRKVQRRANVHDIHETQPSSLAEECFVWADFLAIVALKKRRKSLKGVQKQLVVARDFKQNKSL